METLSDSDDPLVKVKALFQPVYTEERVSAHLFL